MLSTVMFHHLSPSAFPHYPACPFSPVPRWRGHEDADGRHTTCQIPHQDNIHSTAVRPHFWTLITDPALLSPSGPSTPPEELQLNALDSSSVLVSWRPPLEPNGIIISYRILYSGNLSQPEHLWEKLSQDGGCWLAWPHCTDIFYHYAFDSFFLFIWSATQPLILKSQFFKVFNKIPD